MTVKEKNQYIYSSTIQFFSRLQNEKYEMSRSYKFTAFFFFFFALHLVVPQGKTASFTHRNAREENKS